MSTETVPFNITLPKKLLNSFKAFCKAHGMKPSPRIAVLIRQDLAAHEGAP